MARKRSTARLLLDTSAVVHQMHGHTLQQAAVREAVGGAEVLVPGSVTSACPGAGACTERRST